MTFVAVSAIFLLNLVGRNNTKSLYSSLTDLTDRRPNLFWQHVAGHILGHAGRRPQGGGQGIGGAMGGTIGSGCC